MNVFGSTSSTGLTNIDTSLFVQKPYLRSNYIEFDMEEDIDMKQKFKITNLVDPTNDFEAANTAYVDKNINKSTLLRIPIYEPLTNDYVSLKNTVSDKVVELATTIYVKDDISIKNYNKTNDTIDSIDIANHDFTPEIVTLPTKQHMDEKNDERSLLRIPYYENFQNDYIHLVNDLTGQDVAFATTEYVDSKLNRTRRSINEHPDILRKDLEHTFGSKFVYNNFYKIYSTGRTNASSEISPDHSFLGIPYTIFTVTGPNAKVAQIHISNLNVNIGSQYTLRFLIRSQSLKNIKFGFSNQFSEHVLSYDFELIELTATHTNPNDFNVFIDLASFSVGETIEIAALYIEALNTSDQINENIDLKFQHKVINSDDPTGEYDLVTKRYIDSHSNIVYNNKINNFNNNRLTNIANPVNTNDAATKNYIDNDNTIVRNNKNNNFNNNIISNIGNPVNTNDAANKNYIDSHNNIVYNNKENSFNNNKITDIGNPVNANDAVNKAYIDSDSTIVRNNQVNNFNNNRIINIGNPVNANDAVTKSYIDSDSTIVRNNKNNNFNKNRIINIGYPVDDKDAVTKSYIDSDSTIVRNNKNNNFNNNRIINIGYPVDDKDAVTKSYIDDNVKAAISTHPYVLKYQLEKIFASPHIFDKFYRLKYNEFPFNGGNNTTSYTVNDLSFLGEKYERYKCTGGNSYTMHIPKNNLPELIQNKTYKMTFIMRGVNSSIGKRVGLGIWKETGQSQKFSILKESWSFTESEEVVNNANSFNFFLRLNGQSANLTANEEVDVAALYIKEIGTINNFNDRRITNVKDPVDDSDAATKQYVDNRNRVIEIKSKTIMLSSGRIIRAGLSGSFSTTMTQNIIINGSRVTSFTKPSNEDRSITVFQNPIELSSGDELTFHSSNSVDVFAIWVEVDL